MKTHTEYSSNHHLKKRIQQIFSESESLKFVIVIPNPAKLNGN